MVTCLFKDLAGYLTLVLDCSDSLAIDTSLVFAVVQIMLINHIPSLQARTC